MICPMCDRAIKEDEVLMLADDNSITHCVWVMDDIYYMDLCASKPDEYIVSINFSKES